MLCLIEAVGSSSLYGGTYNELPLKTVPFYSEDDIIGGRYRQNNRQLKAASAL